LAGIFHANAPKVDPAWPSASPDIGGAVHLVGARVARGAYFRCWQGKSLFGAQKRQLGKISYYKSMNCAHLVEPTGSGIAAEFGRRHDIALIARYGCSIIHVIAMPDMGELSGFARRRSPKV
jgi:hypothetical protein